MKQIQEFFINIDRADINENTKNLVSDDIIDSIDIMALVAEIEKYYKIPIDMDLISPENFEDFESIKKMIQEVLENS
ncbi:phosphopantetheine-binding protein [Campylobacter insulaenigrae]|uniref:phosphopantetheine-binding protein n=1 Tax=Campylobacter insulaenigrae TaxID=260714 RepID=UPI002152E17F|nr:phosphopantetheine-binding protein [Campylobacter insulaenigrae]MCR6571312.1 phosphopantetheine-binding protein [Campylobacter insulaenigrae]MCR6574632.1 phosphopantetheine-binding protein [Campylobacter insulaenigrae]MCR6576035.1 phosphopantetheine-binding protein [Campylobacter insulaenigrae]MCR6580737.1 phosphopantetheine-binding protein [Campylobacter insulaenigrae]MCR6586577.1 phosphopantetheine-binding protein [Campylobacter insulaenigrae]